MKTIEKNLFYTASKVTLVILLIVSPVLLGSNRQIFELINLSLVSLALAFFIFSGNMSKLLKGLNSTTRNLLIFMFLLVPLWIAFQATPFSPKFLHHPIWGELNMSGSSAISINPGLTWSSLTSYLSLSIIFIGIYMAIYDIRSALKLQIICLLVINAVSLFGLVVIVFDLETLGIVEKNSYSDWLTGTFVYKNAMSNFIGFGVVICVVYLIELLMNGRSWVKNVSVTTQVFVISMNLVFLIVVQVMTGSRGGTISILIAIIFTLVLVFYSKRKSKRKKDKMTLSTYIATIVMLLLVVISFYYLAEGRGGSNSISSAKVRLNLIIDGFSAVLDRPFLGHGVGAFIDVEPLYHQLNISNNILWNKLHTTHLELMLTLGLPVFLIAYYFIFMVLIRLFKRCVKSNTNWLLTLPAIAIVIELLVHALFDFTVQIPAVSLYALILISLSFNQKIRKKNVEIEL